MGATLTLPLSGTQVRYAWYMPMQHSMAGNRSLRGTVELFVQGHGLHQSYLEAKGFSFVLSPWPGAPGPLLLWNLGT